MHADVRRGTALCALLALTQAFYIPGFTFKSYRDGETIPLFVNKVYSDKSELQYAYTELPFVCPPTHRIKTGRFTSGASISLNLGEVLRGDRITVSDYELIMGNDEEARYLCAQTVDQDGLKRTRELIRDGYVAEWIVDNLPGATSFQTTDKSRKYYAAGFKIGEEVVSKQGGLPQYLIYNHVTLVIRYHRAPGKDGDRGKKVIVGFEVFPKSIAANNRTEDGLPKDLQNVRDPMMLIPTSNSTGEIDESEAATLTIPFTYSVYFREDEQLQWQNRWDRYFVAQEDSSNVHWLAIVNSLVIAGLLTAVVAVILARTVRGDIKGYQEDGGKPKLKRARGPMSPTNGMEKGGLLDQLGDLEGEADVSDDEEPEDITGWKLVHGDVFRAPPHGGLLAPLIGSGTQLLFMAIGILLLSAFGILNPSFRGGYVSVGTGLWVFAGLFSGYFSSRVYKTFGGQLWQKNVFVTASLVPGLLFSTIFVLNLFVWIQASSTAIPFGTLVGLVALWLFIQLPLVYVGGWYGYTQVGSWTHPIKANAIPRQIPAQPWFTKDVQAILLAGFVPFAVVFIELMFVFKSLWVDKSGYYYVFGFMAVVSVILLVTVIEVTVMATYIQLCSENYHWWWQSFLIGGSSALWIYAYLAWYFFARLHITGFVSSLLFFAYGGLACAVYGLLTGTVGFLSAYAFVRRIYR
ncbi:multispanning membrane protein [Trematosphaeria pertusa]|uniref:Transmembrane 9 superfamily member n=1 Tax=Trematosphaeria pertusa TaxID=390896 RepID=A0A6A6I8T4_9PLEO|nr:multispanning membrane protein [Trematosphaeria pertusa]KAF2246488.1 multispanning membrane protein [Trematosphaeria pertusa]